MVKKLVESTCFLANDLTHLRELLHPANDDAKTLFGLAHAFLEVGKSSLPHRLVTSSETYFILEGQGQMNMDGKVFSFEVGDTIFVPPNSLQSVRNTGQTRLSFLCIVSPPWSPDDDVVAG